MNSNSQFLFLGQAIGEFSRGRVRRTVHCSQAIGRLHTTRKMVFTPWFRAVHTVSCWGLPCRKKRSPNDFTSPKSLLKWFYDSTTVPLLETEFCSDFGFIEAALKCLHTVYKFCNRTQYPCLGILSKQATYFDGNPAVSRSTLLYPALFPPLADRAPSSA